MDIYDANLSQCLGFSVKLMPLILTGILREFSGEQTELCGLQDRAGTDRKAKYSFDLLGESSRCSVVVPVGVEPLGCGSSSSSAITQSVT